MVTHGVTLALDASTYVGTVAVLRGHTLAAEGEAIMRGENEERLMPAVVAALEAAECSVRDVTRVVCGGGPGSFTSLRIAGAIAKGIVMGNGTSAEGLYAVSSLALTVAGCRPPLGTGRWLALLDAMRGERYAALYDVGAEGEVREVARLGLIAEGDVARECERLGARAAGPFVSPGIAEAAPHARGALALLDTIIAGGAVSLDAWEPEYGRLAEAQVRWEAAHGRSLGR
jgi:tRNA threonylcarbamoyladenosine biosynthesis protein TsaB